MASWNDSHDEKQAFDKNRAWFTEIQTELLEMRGKEGIDLLERISTNELIKLGVGAWRGTILTNEKGRMIDEVWVGRKADDLVFLVTEAHSAEKTRKWIEKFIIMEDVHLAPPDIRYRHLKIIGEIELPQNILSMAWDQSWGEVKIRHILVPEERGSEIVQHLQESGVKQRMASEYEDFRITTGIPLGTEINEDYNPLEAGMGHLISWTKGCYVGQEVIARLDTYKKVQKQLVRLEFSEAVKTVPRPIRNAVSEVGLLTSSTSHEPFVGLGYIATRHLGTEELFVEGEGGPIRVKMRE